MDSFIDGFRALSMLSAGLAVASAVVAWRLIGRQPDAGEKTDGHAQVTV
jgi:hypothetical protein